MALHKQETNNPKPKKSYPNNYTLYPNAFDKFLIHYDVKEKCYRVTHYSRWAFRGEWSGAGVKTGQFGQPGFMVRRNDWTYQIRFESEIHALEFAKEKAAKRGITSPVFLLQLDA